MSAQLSTAAHLCACGCDREVVTPLSPAQWVLTLLAGDLVFDALRVPVLEQLVADHRGLNKLLDLLRDQPIHLCLRATDPALVSWLGELTGSSAAAKSARLLLG